MYNTKTIIENHLNIIFNEIDNDQCEYAYQWVQYINETEMTHKQFISALESQSVINHQSIGEQILDWATSYIDMILCKNLQYA